MSFLKKGSTFRLTAFTILLAFGLNVVSPAALGYGQTPAVGGAGTPLILPNPGAMVGLSQPFVPVILRGLKVHPDNPFQFDFVMDSGTAPIPNPPHLRERKGWKDSELQEESIKLIKYFLAALTVPEDDLWVNLSPYEKDKIIPDAFGQTEMGRDLLAQDYILKQLTASLLYPENDLGKEFWQRVYQKAKEKYGTTEIPINTFNKVWIVPEKAEVYETEDTAFITKSRLKVMLESDYLALQNNINKEEIGTDQLASTDVEQLSDVSSQIVKDIILPEIEKEVNEGKNFAKLRQIYHSLILAAWFKRVLKENINGIYSPFGHYIDQNKIDGVDIEDKDAKQKIYEQYLEAFRKGVYNYIKEDYDSTTEEIIERKYFSGGMLFGASPGAFGGITKILERKSAKEGGKGILKSIVGIFVGLALGLTVGCVDSVENHSKSSSSPNILQDSATSPLTLNSFSEDPAVVTLIEEITSRLTSASDLDRLEIAESLNNDLYFGYSKAINILINFLSDLNPVLRIAALEALETIGVNDIAVIQAILKVLHDPDPSVRKQAVQSIGRIVEGQQPLVIQALIGLMSDSEVRREVVEVLGEIGAGNPLALQALLKATDPANPANTSPVIQTALAGLQRIGHGSTEALTTLAKASPDSLNGFKLSGADPSQAIKILIEMYENKLEKREDIIYPLANIGGGKKEVLTILLKGLNDDNSNVRLMAADSLSRFQFGRLSKSEAALTLVDLLFSMPEYEIIKRAVVIRALKIVGYRDKAVIEKLQNMTGERAEYSSSILDFINPIDSEAEAKKEGIHLDLAEVDTINGILDGLPADNQTKAYHLRGTEFYVYAFANGKEQSLSLERLATFAERAGYQGKILNDAEMLAANLDSFEGHDYPLEVIAEFFTLAEQQKVSLSKSEVHFRNQLLAPGLLSKTARGYEGKKGAVFISFSQDNDPNWRSQVLSHELSHALYFSSPEYRATIKLIFDRLTEEQQRLVEAFLVEKGGYAAGDEDLMLREFAGYFQDPQTLVDMFDHVFEQSHFGNKGPIGHLSILYEGDAQAFIARGDTRFTLTEEAKSFVINISSRLGLVFRRFLGGGSQEPLQLQEGQSEIPDVTPAPKKLDPQGVLTEVEEAVQAHPGMVRVFSLVSSGKSGVAGPRAFHLFYSYQEITDTVENLRFQVISSVSAVFKGPGIRRRVIEALDKLDTKNLVRLSVAGEEIMVIELDEDGNLPMSEEEFSAEKSGMQERLGRNKAAASFVVWPDSAVIFRRESGGIRREEITHGEKRTVEAKPIPDLPPSEVFHEVRPDGTSESRWIKPRDHGTRVLTPDGEFGFGVEGSAPRPPITLPGSEPKFLRQEIQTSGGKMHPSVRRKNVDEPQSLNNPGGIALRLNDSDLNIQRVSRNHPLISPSSLHYIPLRGLTPDPKTIQIFPLFSFEAFLGLQGENVK